MINAESLFLECINSPVRSIRGRVELYDNSTLLQTFKYTDYLKSFSIERVGEESKFFGFGICHKLNIKLRDTKREINNISTENYFEAVFGSGSDYIYAFPAFKVSEVHRNENTNELSITAYDMLYQASKHTVSELALPDYYTIGDFAKACASLLGLPLAYVNVNDNSFSTFYNGGANFEGTESIREALNAVAEATQTIYYISSEWQLTFKRLDKDGEAVFTIDKEKYFDLDSGANRRLGTICHATELGDNVSASIEASGTTQYVRDNPFWDMRDDVGTLVSNAISLIGGLTINQFDLEWRGNYLLEIGDKIAITTKDGSIVYSYLLDDSIEYDGGLRETSRWSYTADEETESNPATLGDRLKQTYAKVDKQNKTIEMVASQAEANAESISSLQMNTESITASVSKMSQNLTDSLTATNEEISTLTNKVEATMSAEDIQIQIQSELANGVDKVITSTGFTFDEVGLTVSKSGSEMETTITEDGMTVYRDEEAVLTANNIGVDAVNLHAKTYLIIGENSRFEDYGSSRTGCFWIGG